MSHPVTMFAVVSVLCCAISVILAIPFDVVPEHEYELDQDIGFTYEMLAALPAAKMYTPAERIQNAGYVAETHKVVTQDGYILEVHRISGSKKYPPSVKKPAVLLMHGLLDCSATWVISSPEQSLGFLLADWGFDVWMGNARGNRYSRGHTKWTTLDKEFWSFSWHEIGVYDIPAIIDHILEKTELQKIFYIGHSQGGTSFFVMASERPEYQKKLIASFNLAPAVFMKRMFSPVMRLLVPFANDLKKFSEIIGMYEFKPTSDTLRKWAEVVCQNDAPTQFLCSNMIFLIGGFRDKDLNVSLIPSIVQYDPAGASTLQFLHYAQIIKTGNFQKMDYGRADNLKKYGSAEPPQYNLANINMPVYLHYGSNDWMVNTKDLEELHSTLSNSKKFLVPYKQFTHLDFLWGMHAKSLLYDNIISLIFRHKKEFEV